MKSYFKKQAGLAIIGLAVLSSLSFAIQCGNNYQGCDPEEEDCCSGNGGANKFSIYTGSVHREIKDLEVWGGVGDHQLVWKRYGASRFDPTSQRFFGWAHNWRHNYQWQMSDAGINPGGQPQVDIVYPSGTSRRFTKIANSNEWRSSPKVPDIITQNGTTLTLQRGHGWQYHFEILTDAQGNTFYQLQSFQDSQQSTYTLSYGGPGPNGFPELIRISEPGGRYLTISYADKAYDTDQTITLAPVTQASQSSWNEITVSNPNFYRYLFYGGPIGSNCAVAEIEFYEYGTNQKLSGTPIGTSPAKTPGHEYDKAFDGDLNTYFEFSNVYYGYTGLDFGSGKRIGKIRFRSAPGVDMVGGAFRASNLVPAVDRVISQVTTSDGRSVSYQYKNYSDSVLASNYIGIEKALYGDGTTAQYQYGAAISGTVPVLTYANDTRLIGNASNIAYQYYAESVSIIGFIHKELNGVNGATMATLSGDGNETMYVDYSNGGKETYYFPWAQAGQLNSHTNALGYTHSYSYDQGGKGYLIAETDANGNTTSYQRNTQGDLLATHYPDGTQKTWTRDNLNLVLSETDALGNTTTYTRDNNHRITKIDYPDASSESFAYNAFNQVTQHTLRNGGIEHNTYGPTGLKVSHTDPLGHVTSYTYDTADHLASVTDPNGHTTQFAYNERGLITQITYADNSTRTFAYDALGNKVSETNELGKTWNYTYDEFSRITSATDPLNRTVQYNYGIGLAGGCSSCHLEDNPTKITLPSGKETTYTYDLIWQKVTETIGNNTPDAATTQYVYDPVGNLTHRIDPTGANWQYEYDARNRVSDTLDPLGQQTTWSYDANGNKQTEVRADGSTTQYAYDTMNRPTATSDALKQTTQYQYDSAGNLSTLIDPKGNTYKYKYDLLSRLLSLRYPDSSKESYQYDPAGNRTQYTTRAGQALTCTFDTRNRDTLCDWSDTTPDISKSYDAANRLMTINSAVSQINYTYDDANELVNERQSITGYPMPFNLTHQYDLDGNPNALLYPSGANVQYTYSARNQIAGVLFNNNALASYQYDLNGQRTLKTLANGGITKYDYDAARQLTMLKQSAPGLSASSDYTYDAVGNRTSHQRSDGTTETYGYDATDQLTGANFDNQAIGLKDHNVTYTYDPSGNRIDTTDNGDATAYASNPLNQYTTVAGDPLSYDANGNLASQKGWTYTYDAQNRITNAQRGSIQMSFAYDGLNRCIKRTLNGTSTYLCHAGWNLIEEHSGNSTLLASYVHGPNTDEILSKTDITGAVYYHQDALGNVTYLTDASGNVIEQYRYDAFGKPTFLDAQNNVLANSAYGNRFLFTGREWLQDIALYDYRNRIYSVELGRFLQNDPIHFDAGDVNLYRYCANNPTNWIDADGLVALDVNTTTEYTYGEQTGSTDANGVKMNGFCLCNASQKYDLFLRISGTIKIKIDARKERHNRIYPNSQIEDGVFRPPGMPGTELHERHHAGAYMAFFRAMAGVFSKYEKEYSKDECENMSKQCSSAFERAKARFSRQQSSHTPGWNDAGAISDAPVTGNNIPL